MIFLLSIILWVALGWIGILLLNYESPNITTYPEIIICLLCGAFTLIIPIIVYILEESFRIYPVEVKNKVIRKLFMIK